jgi:hypothetical protein
MAESVISNTTADALAGQTSSSFGFTYPNVGESYATTGLRRFWTIFNLLELSNNLRVYKDGDLTFGVRAGKFLNGDSQVSYAGAAAQALTDDDDNYIYLTAAGTLTVNTTGFPDPSTTPHIRLATIATGSESAAAVSGEYDFADMVDYRSTGLFRVAHGGTAADGNTLTDGSNADALHVHEISAAELADALADMIPQVDITASAEGATTADTIDLTVQLQDAAGNSLAARGLCRVWFAATEYAVPDATDNTASVDTGTAIETVTANAEYRVLSDATGLIEMSLAVSGSATRYLMVELGGIVYSSGALTFAA